MRKKLFLISLISILCAISVSAQSLIAKGVVYDEFNEPFAGVNIRLKSDPSKGASTNMDGEFTLPAKKGDVLIFTFVGFKTAEVVAGTNMKVQMEPDSELLDDVVVIGYMQRKITNTSASVVKLGSKDLANKPTANPLDGIQGKVSGLQVFSSSGEPSSQLSILLHGQGSLGAGSEPLFIMDGMPVSLAAIQAMNPNDFESVQFLKDASATSVYGARAANGVVYITTKRGRSDDAAITIRGQYGVSTLANTSYFEQLMSTDDLLRYYSETGAYTDKQVASLREQIGDTDFKWYKYIYQPAPLYKADMSISGSSGRTNYYLSGGGVSQQGLRHGSYYKKIFARLNLNTEVNDYVRVSLNTFMSNDWRQTSPHSNGSVLGGLGPLNSPFISPYDKDGKELEYIPALTITTPKHTIDKKPAGASTFIVSTNGSLTITPFRNFVIRSMAGMELDFDSSFSRVKPSYRYAYGNGSSSKSNGKVRNLSTTNTITYTLDGLGHHGLTVLGGHEYVDFHHDGISASGNGIQHDDLLSLNMVTKDKYIREDLTEYSFLSFFTQIAYNYTDRYFLDLVFRNDASSRFGKDTRNGQFWSAGLLWKMKEESFLKGVSWLNELDLKASYGTQGNSAIPPYSTLSYVGKSGQYNGQLGVGIQAYGNTHLSWERQSKFTIGLKGRVLNRIGINLEYYYRLTKDMITEIPLDHTSGLGKNQLGYTVYLDNAGKYLNQGVDLKLTADILSGRDYGVTTYVNFNYNADKVVELFNNRQQWFEPGSGIAYIVGKPLTFVTPIYKGINPDNGRPEWYKPGDDISVKTTDDSRLVSEYGPNLEQNTYIPVLTPITGGWGIDGQWKDLFFGVDFAFALGKHMLSQDRQYFENDLLIRDREQNLNGSKSLFNYWKNPGDHAEFPSLEYVREKNANHASIYPDDRMIENASFMRMKNLMIGYNLPESIIDRQGLIKSAKVFFSGRNLLTFTKFKGIDPEVNQNASFGANPNTKQVSVNVELSF